MLPGDKIIERIEKALAIDGTHTWEDVREMIVDGRCQIFWNDSGAWITEVIVSPRKRMLNVWIVAGELPDVMSVQEQVEKFALTQTCDRITAVARFGWENVAREHGWQKHAMVLTHAVEGP